MATNQGFKSFIPDSTRLDAKFLLWWLRSKRSYLQSLGNGATFKEVSKATVSRVQMPLPPLAEQRRIAGTLDKADALRAKRRATIIGLKEMKAAKFREVFGELRTDPRGWDTASLGELIVDGPQNGIYKPSSDYGSGTRILRIDGFYDGAIVDQSALKRVALSDEEIAKYCLRASDIVINRVNSREYLGKSALVPVLDESTVYESNMMRFALDTQRVAPIFMIELLQTESVRHHILSAAKDAINQSSINQQDVRSIPVMIPPLSVQQSFVQWATSHAVQSYRLAESATKLDELFQSLQESAFKSPV